MLCGDMEDKMLRQRQAERARKWFQNRFLLQDWKFIIILSEKQPIGKNDPDEPAACWPDRNTKMSTIWVSNQRGKDFPGGPLTLLFHELLETGMFAEGFEIEGETTEHGMLCHIAENLTELYRLRRGR